MSATERGGRDLAAELRLAFDRSFASAATPPHVRGEDLLAITAGTTPYAVRLADVSGVFADRRIVPVPTSVPELLGLAGVRTAILPVYDLAMLLGCPSAEANRWLLVAARMAVGFACARFDGHLRVRPEAIVPLDDRAVRQHVREVVRRDEMVRPIASLTSVLETITGRVRMRPVKER